MLIQSLWLTGVLCYMELDEWKVLYLRSYAKTMYNMCESITNRALLCLMVTESPALNQTNIYADQKEWKNVQQSMLKNVTEFSFLFTNEENKSQFMKLLG